MANELTLSVLASFAKGEESFDTDDLDLKAQSVTIAGTKYVRGNQTATTSAAALALGSVTSCGMAAFRNRGSVSIYVRSGASGANTIWVPAALGFVCFLATNTPYIIAASSSAELEYIILSQ